MKKNILFVDDEPNLLQGLQRMLRPMRHEWEMVFAESGPEALKKLKEANFEVIVTDMRMPGMDGAQLLEQVVTSYPETIRIILSGNSDQQAVLKSVGCAHQFLSKPCDAEALKGTIARASALRNVLFNDSLKKLVSQLKTLPSLPSLYIEVVNELRQPEASLSKIGEIISKDVGMAAKILQLVNSAFFGLQREMSSPAEAVRYLGLETIRALVLSINIFSQFDSSAFQEFPFTDLWNHSMNVGTYAKQIAVAEKQPRRIVEEAFMAGLLHDSGKLLLAANLPAQYQTAFCQAREKAIALTECEREICGATHAEVGAYLLGLWGLPDPIVEAVAFHHCPQRSTGSAFSPLTAVHAANVLEHRVRLDPDRETTSELEFDYLAGLGLAERIDEWQSLVSADA